MLQLIFGIFAIIAAIISPHLYRTLNNAGVFDKSVHFVDPQCKMINRPELVGCEGGQIHYPSHTAIFACAYNLTERQAWYPPGDLYDKSVYSHGGITVFDIKSKTSRKLILEGFDDEFSPLGFGFAQDPANENILYMAIANHKRSGSVVERFKYEIGSTKAVHYETVTSPKIHAPNDIYPIDAHQFYVTNDFATLGFWRFIEKFTRRPWGNVIFYDGSKAKEVASEIAYANGIKGIDDIVYVVSTTERELLVYEKKEDYNLRFRERIPLGMLADNISIDQTRAVFVTGHPKLIQFLLERRKPSPKSPSLVQKVTQNTQKQNQLESDEESEEEQGLDYGGKINEIFLGKKYLVENVFGDNGTLLTTSSITLVDTELEITLISGIYTTGILYCDKLPNKI